MITWTKEEIAEFNSLVDKSGSRDQIKRIEARLGMRNFVEKHGDEKCDAMWKHLNKGGSIEARNQ